MIHKIAFIGLTWQICCWFSEIGVICRPHTVYACDFTTAKGGRLQYSCRPCRVGLIAMSSRYVAWSLRQWARIEVLKLGQTSAHHSVLSDFEIGIIPKKERRKTLVFLEWMKSLSLSHTHTHTFKGKKKFKNEVLDTLPCRFFIFLFFLKLAQLHFQHAAHSNCLSLPLPMKPECKTKLYSGRVYICCTLQIRLTLNRGRELFPGP
jgi:hypothetical protein